MTPEEVVKLANFNARELGLKWMTTKTRDIRLKRDNREYCPIEVAGNFEELNEAAHDLNLLWPSQSLVMHAADDDCDFTDGAGVAEKAKALRQLMLNTFEFEVPHVAG
jgi:hypothetical protein